MNLKYCDKKSSGTEEETPERHILMINIDTTTNVEKFEQFVFSRLDTGDISGVGKALLTLKTWKSTIECTRAGKMPWKINITVP